MQLRSTKACIMPVGFFHLSPNWQKWSSRNLTSGWSKISFITGVIQHLLECGFSTAKGMRKNKQANTILAVNHRSWLPTVTFCRSRWFRFWSPMGVSSLRKGPGPTPSSLRATLNEVHGIPIHTKRTRPCWRRESSWFSTSAWRTSSSEIKQLSIAKDLTPRLYNALVNLPEPAKISKKHGLSVPPPFQTARV